MSDTTTERAGAMEKALFDRFTPDKPWGVDIAGIVVVAREQDAERAALVVALRVAKRELHAQLSYGRLPEDYVYPAEEAEKAIDVALKNAGAA